jgi:hypothetical protein
MKVVSALDILYDSDSFCVAEFAGGAGIELVDKQARRSGFLAGPVAARLRSNVAQLCSADLGDEAVDEFLCTYQALLTNTLRLH